MALTKIITARVDRDTKRRLAREAQQESRSGARVQEADITRRALIEYFERKDKEKKKEPVPPGAPAAPASASSN